MNQVYRCPNKECSPYHLKGAVLLDVKWGDKRFSIDTAHPSLRYVSGSETLSVDPSLGVTCYHCNGVVEAIPYEDTTEADKKATLDKITACEDKIAKLLEQFK